jgi:hypothetical protein
LYRIIAPDADASYNRIMNERGKRLLANLLMIIAIGAAGYFFVRGNTERTEPVSQDAMQATSTPSAPAEPVAIESARIMVPGSSALVQLSNGRGRYVSSSDAVTGEIELAAESVERDGRVYAAFKHSVGTSTPTFFLAYLKRGDGTLDHVDSIGIDDAFEIDLIALAEFGDRELGHEVAGGIDGGDSIVVEYQATLSGSDVAIDTTASTTDDASADAQAVQTSASRAFFRSSGNELRIAGE